MRESTHAATGAVIGLYVINPVWAFLAGVGLHLVLDATKHLDPGHYGPPDENGQAHEFPNYSPMQFGAMAADFVGMVAIFIWVSMTHLNTLSLWCAIFGAVLPDILLLLPRVGITFVNGKWLQWFHFLHHHVHFRIKSDQRWWSWHEELIIFIFSLWWLAIY